MYSVKYTDNAQLIIKDFIRSYKNVFLERFTDTGLITEDIIRNIYIEKSVSFYEEIINQTDTLLWEEIILGYFPITKQSASIYIRVNNFKLKILYTDDKSKKIREVYDIEFHKN